MASGFRAEEADNLREIEMQWAVKAMDHAETYIKILKKINPTSLNLTRVDDELYEKFRLQFPDLNVQSLKPDDFNTTEAAKAKWRSFINSFEKKVEDFNFGTLLRLDASKDYTEENTFFVTRTQFYAIEIARNREGINYESFHRKFSDDGQ